MCELSHNMFRVCWGFAFGANAAKFSSGQDATIEHSLSYVTEEQQSPEENLASATQRVNPQQTLTLEID